MSSKQEKRETVAVDHRAITYSYSYTYVTAVTICAQFVGLMTAYALGVTFQYGKLTETHCNVPNFWPSISKCTGEYLPGRYIWRLGISITAFPRLMDAFLYYKYFANQRPKFLQSKVWYKRLNKMNFLLFAAELFLLYTVTFISSKEHSDIHIITWIIFLAFALSHMITFLILFGIPLCYGRNLLTPLEKFSMKFRCVMFALQVLILIGFFYFAIMHTNYCQPYAFSYGAICEFFIAASNWGFQWMQFLDFKSIRTVFH